MDVCPLNRSFSKPFRLKKILKDFIEGLEAIYPFALHHFIIPFAICFVTCPTA